MRFVIVVAEIIGNATTPVQFLGPDLMGLGDPIHMAAAEMLMAVMRSLPCCNRALDHLSAFAAKVTAWTSGDRLAA